MNGIRFSDHARARMQQRGINPVIPCSGRKRPGGVADRDESILDCLPSGLADELRMQRERNAPAAELNAARRLPATERYSGYLYEAAGTRTFERLDDAGSRIAIISGGYGLVLGYERIGMYDQVFKGAMWPERLIQRCLSACAQVTETRTVVGLLSASTSYAKVFRGARWPAGVAQAFLLSPEPTCGAMVKVPRTQGEALAEIARSGHLLPGWRSSDGLGMVTLPALSWFTLSFSLKNVVCDTVLSLPGSDPQHECGEPSPRRIPAPRGGVSWVHRSGPWPGRGGSRRRCRRSPSRPRRVPAAR